MTAAEGFIRAALFALDEARAVAPEFGELTIARATLVGALERAQPLVSLHKPSSAKKVPGWAAMQMAMSAEHPARAYSRLRELLASLFDPFTNTRPMPPAPEVAMTLRPAALVEALAPSPRVLSRALALAAKLDGLVMDAAIEVTALAIRATPMSAIGAQASELADIIACSNSPELRREALSICQPAADKARAKVAEALHGHATSTDSAVRARAIEGIHMLRFQLDDEALLAALRDASAEVRTVAARTIGTGRRGYASEIEERILGLVSDDDRAVRIAALGAIVRFPTLLRPSLLEPLQASMDNGGEEGKTALFLLGRLGAHPNTSIELREREGVPVASSLEGSPRDVEDHGAYAIGRIETAIGVWDRGTRKRLFAIERALILGFIPGRAEIAAIRTEPVPRSRKPAWHFDRHRIPGGERLGSITVPAVLTHGAPSKLSIAADLVTVWCDHPEAPYRFHVKLGEPDVVLDDAPVLGRPTT